jgi:tetratricopeptide (TPR) repeat protein
MDISCSEFVSQVDSYLENTLTEEKREILELHYFQCDECFAQLQASERLHSKEVHIVAGGTQPASVWHKLWSWKPAVGFAALFLIIFTSFLAINGFKKASQMDFLYRISDVPAPAYMISETRDAGIASTGGSEQQAAQLQFEEAMIHYNGKQYAHALMILKQIPDNQFNPRISFFKAICFLYLDELKAAVASLDQIIATMDPSYYDEAIYYKAIALLRMGKKKSAKEQLNNLSEMFSPLAPKAKDLINKLN